MKGPRFPTFVATVVILTMLLGACQSAPAAPTQQPPASVPTKQSPTAVPTQPSKPVVVTIGQALEIPTIDPALWGFTVPVTPAMYALYDALVESRGNPPEAKPLLAKSWKVSDDLKEWTFSLDERAKFHDGSPVTAEAVKWSWQRFATLKQGMFFVFAGFTDKDTCSVVDERTVRFTLKQPSIAFLSYVHFVRILNPKVVQANKKDGAFGDEGDYGQAWLVDHEAGSGPFTIERWAPNGECVLNAVPTYWHGWPNGKHVDSVVIKLFRELTPRVLALQTGEIDFANFNDITADLINQLSKRANLATKTHPEWLIWTFQLNNQRGPTADVNVRKAIQYAFDYDGFLPTVPAGVKVEGPFPKGVQYSVAQDMPKFDLAKAKEYLAKSKYPDGGFTLNVVYTGTTKLMEQAALVLLEGLKKLNITLNLVPKTWSEGIAMCAKQETAPDIFVCTIGSRTADPDFAVRRAYYSKAWGQFGICSYYKNPEVDTLIEAASAERDPKVRASQYAEIQKLVMADSPEVWWAQPGLVSSYTVKLKGVDTGMGPFSPWCPYLADLYVEGQ